MSAVQVAGSQLTADCVNPVISATRNVFETMLGCTPVRTALSLKGHHGAEYDISAVIGITGKISGTIVVSLALETALQLLNRMLGIEATEINREVADAVGELTNMIAGSAKAQMEKLQLSISIPNIVSGKNHAVHYPSNVHPICIAYKSEIGPFAIEVGFSEST